MNQYDPAKFSSLLAFEDTLYLAMDKRKITDFLIKK